MSNTTIPMQTQSDLVIVCPHLGAGGTQRVISTLSDAWAQQGRRLCVVMLYEHDAVYALGPAVRTVCLHTMMMQDRRQQGRLRRFITWLHARLMERLLRLRSWLSASAVGRWITQRRVRIAASPVGAWRGWFHLHSTWSFLKRMPRRIARVIGGAFVLVAKRFFRYKGEYYYAYRQVKTLRRFLRTEAAAVVLAFIGKTNMVTILACWRLSRRVVISERNDPARQELDGLWNKLRPILYGRADIVTANSMHALETMRRYVQDDKLAYLPNPLLLPVHHNGQSTPEVETPYILSVGRLHPQKAHDVLLRAFQLLPNHFAAWRLVIVGEGALRNDLEQLAETLGIADRVRWTGHVDDPFVYYRDAAVFALPSRHEGTSNALLEAMSYGVPAIVTDACPGSLELVEDGVEGLVIPVDDPGALAAAIMRLAEDAELRRQRGEAARKRVEAFSLPVVLEHWDEVLQT